jgi:hypothetical protein
VDSSLKRTTSGAQPSVTLLEKRAINWADVEPAAIISRQKTKGIGMDAPPSSYYGSFVFCKGCFVMHMKVNLFPGLIEWVQINHGRLLCKSGQKGKIFTIKSQKSEGAGRRFITAKIQ